MNNKRFGNTLPGISLIGTLLLVARTAFAADPVLVVVPEPGTLALITASAAAIGLIYRNRRK